MQDSRLSLFIVLIASVATAAGGVPQSWTVEPNPIGSDARLFQVILNVSDMQKQVCFYRDVLGLEIIYQSSPDAAKASFVRFKTAGAAIVLHAGRTTRNARQEPRISLFVARIEAARKHLLANGVKAGEVRNPAPHVYVVDARDPEGNTFHLESDHLR